MGDSDKISLASKIAGEQLAQSRQWEQIGYVLIAALLTIGGVVVANRAVIVCLPRWLEVLSWLAVAGLLISLCLASARYLSLSILYFHQGMWTVNIAQNVARGTEPAAALFPSSPLTPGDIGMATSVHRVAFGLRKARYMYAPLLAIVVCGAVVASAQLAR